MDTATAIAAAAAVTTNPFPENGEKKAGEHRRRGGGRASRLCRLLPRIRRGALGFVAAVLLPIEKLKGKSPRGLSFEQEIHDFLLTNFNGYTVSSGNISGHWKDDNGRDHYGEHREYRVALPSRAFSASLDVFLAGLAWEMGEECIYVEVASEIFLVYQRELKSGQQENG
jgi:hypothetical protein